MTAFSHRYVEDCHRFRVFVLNNFLFPSCIIVLRLIYTNLTMKPKLSNDFENTLRSSQRSGIKTFLYEKIYYSKSRYFRIFLFATVATVPSGSPLVYGHRSLCVSIGNKNRMI